MAFKLRSNVAEVSTTAGTADYVLSGALATYDDFDFLDNGDTTWFHAKATDGSGDWEEGIATKETGGLERTTILASSNGGAKVDWPDTTPKRIVCGQPAAGMRSIILPTTDIGGQTAYNVTGLALFDDIEVTVEQPGATAYTLLRTGVGGSYYTGGSDYFAGQLGGSGSNQSSFFVTWATGHVTGKVRIRHLADASLYTLVEGVSGFSGTLYSTLQTRNARVAEDCIRLTRSDAAAFATGTKINVTGRWRIT